MYKSPSFNLKCFVILIYLAKEVDLDGSNAIRSYVSVFVTLTLIHPIASPGSISWSLSEFILSADPKHL